MVVVTYYCLAAILIVSVISVTSKPITEHGQKGGGGGGGEINYDQELGLIDDDGSMDTALINYLFARQMMRRLQNNVDVTDLQRKRSYWKQCAFNAVSCFGRRK